MCIYLKTLHDVHALHRATGRRQAFVTGAKVALLYWPVMIRVLYHTCLKPASSRAPIAANVTAYGVCGNCAQMSAKKNRAAERTP